MRMTYNFYLKPHALESECRMSEDMWMRSDEHGAYKIWSEVKRLRAINADSSLAEAMELNAIKWIRLLAMKGHTFRPRTYREHTFLALHGLTRQVPPES